MEKWAQVESKVIKHFCFKAKIGFNDLLRFISQGWRETWGILVQGEIQVGYPVYPADHCQRDESIWENRQKCAVILAYLLYQELRVSARHGGMWSERWISSWPTSPPSWSSLRTVCSQHYLSTPPCAVGHKFPQSVVGVVKSRRRWFCSTCCSANAGVIGVRFIEIQVLIFQHCPPCSCCWH